MQYVKRTSAVGSPSDPKSRPAKVGSPLEHHFPNEARVVARRRSARGHGRGCRAPDLVLSELKRGDLVVVVDLALPDVVLVEPANAPLLAMPNRLAHCVAPLPRASTQVSCNSKGVSCTSPSKKSSSKRLWPQIGPRTKTRDRPDFGQPRELLRKPLVARVGFEPTTFGL